MVPIQNHQKQLKVVLVFGKFEKKYWLAAAVKSTRHAKALIKKWQTNKSEIQFDIGVLPNAKWPVLLLEGPFAKFRAYLVTKQQTQKFLMAWGGHRIAFVIDKEFVSPDGTDWMGEINHYHVYETRLSETVNLSSPILRTPHK